MAKKRRRFRTPPARDAIALLKADHKTVSALFERYEHSRSVRVKRTLAKRICEELTVHTRIEEEIFYPAISPGVRDDDMMNEALVEHAGAKGLIAQLKRGKPGASLYDAKVTVLGEYIKHHVKEEHTEMFPRARRTTVDLKALGVKLLARKRALGAK